MISMLELMDRIAKGEIFLNSLGTNDPKRQTAEANLKNLKAQLTALERSSEAELQRESVCEADCTSPGNFKRYEPPFIEIDPRPDLIDDSQKWTILLKMALELDGDLCGALNGIRCGGTRIRPGRTGSGDIRWILRPDIDPSGRRAWETQTDYEEARDKYLKPHFEEVTGLLQKLADMFPPVEQAVQQEMKI